MAQRNNATHFLLLLFVVAGPTPSSGCHTEQLESMIDDAFDIPFDPIYDLYSEFDEFNRRGHSQLPPEFGTRLSALIVALLQLQGELEARIGHSCWSAVGRELFNDELSRKLAFFNLIQDMFPRNECMQCFGGPTSDDVDKDRLRLDLLEPSCLTGNGNRCSGGAGGVRTTVYSPNPMPLPTIVLPPQAPGNSADSVQTNGMGAMVNRSEEVAQPVRSPSPAPKSPAITKPTSKIRRTQTKIASVQSKIANEAKKPGSPGGKASKVKKLKAWLRRLLGKLRNLLRLKRKKKQMN